MGPRAEVEALSARTAGLSSASASPVVTKLVAPLVAGGAATIAPM